MKKKIEITEKQKEILSRLQTVFADVTGLHDIVPEMNFSLHRNLGISSFALVQLVCALEDEFDISIPNSTLSSFKTVRNVVDFIEKEL